MPTQEQLQRIPEECNTCTKGPKERLMCNTLPDVPEDVVAYLRCSENQHIRERVVIDPLGRQFPTRRLPDEGPNGARKGSAPGAKHHTP
jgi:hypothetical protein